MCPKGNDDGSILKMPNAVAANIDPWVPFLSALAGGFIGGGASVISVILTAKQQKEARQEERSAAQSVELRQNLIEAASRATPLFSEAVHLLYAKDKPLDDYPTRVSDVYRRLMISQATHPAPRIAGLCGDVAADLDSCVIALKRFRAEPNYSEGKVIELVRRGAQAADDLVQQLREHYGLERIPTGRIASPPGPLPHTTDPPP
jgi:hypothetical protein